MLFLALPGQGMAFLSLNEANEAPEKQSASETEKNGNTAKKQRGKATYYSKRATGARTSSGKKLHHDSLTCAHRTYPFGTRLKVTNVNNKKFTIVTVTDRGPYGKGKIIDLTYRAAQELGMISQGVAVVEVEVYDENITPLKPKEERHIPMEFNFVEVEPDSTIGDAIHPAWQKTKKPHKPLPEVH